MVVSIEKYIDWLENLLPNIMKEVCIHNCSMKSTELSRIIRSAYNWERILIHNVILEKENAEFNFISDQPQLTNFLSFQGTGNWTWSDWVENDSQFKAILLEIASSKLVHTLSDINIHDWGYAIDKETKDWKFNKTKYQAKATQGQDYLMKLGMMHINIMDEKIQLLY